MISRERSDLKLAELGYLRAIKSTTQKAAICTTSTRCRIYINSILYLCNVMFFSSITRYLMSKKCRIGLQSISSNRISF